MTWQCLYQFCSDCELAYLPYADIDVTMSVTSVWVSLFIICDSSNNIIWSSSLKAETKSDEEHFQNINFISKERHFIICYLPRLVVGIFSLSTFCNGLILFRNSKVHITWWKSVSSPSVTFKWKNIIIKYIIILKWCIKMTGVSPRCQHKANM